MTTNLAELELLPAAPSEPTYATAPQAAKYLGIGRDSLYELMDRSRDNLPFLQVGRYRYLNLESAREWLRRHEVTR